jgi:hypothetical protein
MINLNLAPKTPDAAAPPSPILIVVGIIFIFLSVFFQAGSMGYVLEKLKTGAATLPIFFSTGSKYYIRLLGLGIVMMVIIGAFVMLAALCIALLKGTLAVIGVPLGILFGMLGVYFVVMLFLSPYAAVVDNKTIQESIKLSMKLVRKNVLPLLGISALLILIAFGMGLVLGTLLAGLNFIIKMETALQTVFAFFSSLVNAYLGVVVTASFMNFYNALPERNT